MGQHQFGENRIFSEKKFALLLSAHLFSSTFMNVSLDRFCPLRVCSSKDNTILRRGACMCVMCFALYRNGGFWNRHVLLFHEKIALSFLKKKDFTAGQ